MLVHRGKIIDGELHTELVGHAARFAPGKHYITAGHVVNSVYDFDASGAKVRCYDLYVSSITEPENVVKVEVDVINKIFRKLDVALIKVGNSASRLGIKLINTGVYRKDHPVSVFSRIDKGHYKVSQSFLQSVDGLPFLKKHYTFTKPSDSGVPGIQEGRLVMIHIGEDMEGAANVGTIVPFLDSDRFADLLIKHMPVPGVKPESPSVTEDGRDYQEQLEYIRERDFELKQQRDLEKEKEHIDNLIKYDEARYMRDQQDSEEMDEYYAKARKKFEEAQEWIRTKQRNEHQDEQGYRVPKGRDWNDIEDEIEIDDEELESWSKPIQYYTETTSRKKAIIDVSKNKVNVFDKDKPIRITPNDKSQLVELKQLKEQLTDLKQLNEKSRLDFEMAAERESALEKEDENARKMAMENLSNDWNKFKGLPDKRKFKDAVDEKKIVKREDDEVKKRAERVPLSALEAEEEKQSEVGKYSAPAGAINTREPEGSITKEKTLEEKLTRLALMREKKKAKKKAKQQETKLLLKQYKESLKVPGQTSLDKSE